MITIAAWFKAVGLGRREGSEPGGRGFVWLVWGLMTALAVGFVARYGTEVPIWDDENLVPVVVGAQPVTPAWLWAQNNEHRIPLPKLILLVADRIAGNDLRAGMFLSVASLAALAAGILILLGKSQGGSRASDAVVPILLLHPGHAANLLWSFQFTMILPTVLATGCLIAIAGRAGRPGVGLAWGVGLILACLPLSSANGLIYVPALAAWLVGSAIGEVRSKQVGSRGRALLIAGAALPGLALAGLYFWGFEPGVHPESRGGLADLIRTAMQFLTGGIGMPAAWAWPWSGLLTVGLLAVSLIWLALAWVTRPKEQPRVFGLIAFLGGVLSISLAVGWGRGWAGGLAGFQDRYVTMATPFWCWLIVVIRLYAPSTIGRILASSLLALGCCLAWPNTELGLQRGRDGVRFAASLTQDINREVPPFQIIHRYHNELHPDSQRLSQLLSLFRAGNIGPFTRLVDNPSFQEITIAVEPVQVRQARMEGTTAHVLGVDPLITFALPRPRYVAGIRLHYSHTNPQGGPARFVATWKGPGDRAASAERRYANWQLPTGSDLETTVWIDATIDEFQIQPDNQPGLFQFEAITLLVPHKP